MKLIVSEAALADLERLHLFLADNNSAAANRAAIVLHKAILSLGVFPERGRPSGMPNVRELIAPFGRSNYLLRYAYRKQADESL
jgi:plasmid stabilization system protein ParE